MPLNCGLLPMLCRLSTLLFVQQTGSCYLINLAASASAPPPQHASPDQPRPCDSCCPRQVLFGCVEEALKATGTKPQAVDILIVNCSLFNPTPSLSGTCALDGP